MSSEQDDLQSYIDGTKNAGSKLVRKYKAAAGKTLNRLKDPKTAEAWHEAVIKDEAMKSYVAATGQVTEADLVDSMEQRGRNNYVTSTGAKVTQNKWLENSKPHRDAAKKFSEDKPIAITNDEKLDNMRKNMEMQQDIKKRRLGIS